MKKFAMLMCVIVCVIGIAGCAWGGVSINAFDPEDRGQLEWYDTGWFEHDSNGEPYVVGQNDGLLGDKEIERIKSLGISGAASLKAIEHLTALEILGISHYNSTEINIRGHTSLREIECYYNDYDYNWPNDRLKVFNISGCPSLKVLSCHDSKQLTELNVSGCPSLQYLECYYNDQQKVLNISGCPSLQRISCWENDQLTELDLSGFAALESLECNRNDQLASLNVRGCTSLQYLYCGGNPLTVLDVGGLVSLQYLYCSDNQLITLNVSGCASLQELDCTSNQLTTLDVGGFAALQSLGCSNNQLTSLNVSGCSSMQWLGCKNNQLTALDVSGYTALQKLYCEKNQLTTLNVSGCTSLQELFCDSNQLATLDLSNLTALTNVVVASNNQLTELDVSGCTALENLSCSQTRLTVLNASGCTALENLFCSNNQLTTLNASGCSALQYLYCENNQLTELDVSGCTALQNLFCYNNKLIALNVSGYTALQYLQCYDNQLTKLDVSGCTALMGLNCCSNQLTELDVSGCNALTELYCHNNELTRLNVSRCNALTKLGCNNNRLEKLDVTSLTALTELYCSDNQMTELDVSNLTALEYLNCQENELEKLDVSGCSSLQTLDCYKNKLTELNVADCTTLEHLQCANNIITELDLSHNTALNFGNDSNGCLWQKLRGKMPKKNSEGFYEVDLKDYVSRIENIEWVSSNSNSELISYNKGTGIAVFSGPIKTWSYGYKTYHLAGNNYVTVPVNIFTPLSIAALERYGSSTYGIICDITDNNYLDGNGNVLTESAIYGYEYSDYGKLGLVADGNSRIILRVLTDKPGTVSFSFNDDIGARLEALETRQKLSASNHLSNVMVSSTVDALRENTYQVSAVLIAPERFPDDKKNFPSDTFSVHVKFSDEDGEITEDDLELKIEAAPVVLIPDELDANSLLYSGYSNAKKIFGVNYNIGIWRELLKIGFEKERVALLDYNSSTGVKDNVNSLFTVLENIFTSYAEEKIVCTKADVVAYGLGGLLVRQFLDESTKSSSYYDINNWSGISYRQGMIHKVVNIAVPHRGTPVANVMLGDMSVIKNDLPPGIDRLAYRILKYFPGMCTDIYATTPQWKDLAVGSDVVNLPFPANVPMHFIYGDVTYSINMLETTKNWALLAFNVCKLIKAISSTFSKFPDLTSYLEDLGVLKEFTNLQGKYMDSFQLLEAIALLDNEVLRVVAEQKDILMKLIGDVKDVVIPFVAMGSNSPNFTGLMQIAEVLTGGVAGLIQTPFDLYFALPKLIFSNQPHDMFIPKSSAMAAFPEYSTVFPVTLSMFDLWSYKYSEICNQADVAKFVGYLLKSAPMGDFAILKESAPLPGSVSSKTSSKSDSDSDIDIDFDNFYVKNFSLTIRKTAREDFGDGMTALKFIAYASIKTGNDVKLVVQKDSSDRIFPMFTENGVRFESLLVFSSSDEGAMTAYCYAPSGKGNLYISDTVNVDVSAAIEEETQEETPPEILTDTLTNAITNQSYSLQLKASGTTPITWTYAGKLPAGLTLSESGLISGTPTKTGKSTFTVTAQNDYGKTSQKYTLQVFDPVSITTASLKVGTIGKSYSVTMRAKGTKTITWTAEGLPNGLTMNAKGKISGKPTVYGMFNVKVKAENGAGSVTKNLTLEIKAIAPKLSGSLKKATLNESYSSGLKVTGSTPITWSIEGNLPDGLTLDSSSGIISGIPTSYAKSGYKITLTATNDGGSKSKKITLKVNGKAPKITAKLPQAIAGENYSAKLSAMGSEPITFTADLPEYLTLDGNTITGNIPESAKNFKVKVYASNPVKTVCKTYTVKVITKKKSVSEIYKAEKGTDITKNDVITVMPTKPEKDTEINSGYIIVAVLGEVSRDVSGMYDFSVELPDYIVEGSELVYLANSDKPSEDDDIAEFYDDTGAEISAVPENRRITVSIWLNPETVYYPVIAVKD